MGTRRSTGTEWRRTRAAASTAARVLFLALAPSTLALVAIAAARGGLWLAALVPAGLLLTAHAKVVARAGLRSWSSAAGTGAVAVACAVLAALGLGPAFGLYRTVTVLSGSMRPTFSPGDVIVVTPEPARSLRVGQVISYQIPVDGRPVETHRVVRIIAPGDEPIVQTKGDANNAVDPWQAKLHGGTLWRYRMHVPMLGYPILALRSRSAHWLLVVFLPALLAAYLVAQIWRPRQRQTAPRHARTDP
jgi:signal peptidase I